MHMPNGNQTNQIKSGENPLKSGDYDLNAFGWRVTAFFAAGTPAPANVTLPPTAFPVAAIGHWLSGNKKPGHC